MSDEEFEEIERIVLGLDEPDSDLYDRVAYLDMVKQHQQAQRRKLALLREGESWKSDEFGQQKMPFPVLFIRTFRQLKSAFIKMPNRFVSFCNDKPTTSKGRHSQPVKNHVQQHSNAAKTSQSLEELSALPIRDTALYAQMDQCDCAMFADCPLGKSRALTTKRCLHSTALKRQKMAPPKGWPPNEKQQLTSSDNNGIYDDEDGNQHQHNAKQYTAAAAAGRHSHTQKQKQCRCRKCHSVGCVKHNKPTIRHNALSLASSSSASSASPSSSSGSTISSAAASPASDHVVAPARGVLFRLPLTISNMSSSHQCRTSRCCDCVVHAASSATGRQQIAAAPKLVNFTQMGLFVAPPSETDPDEAFVVLERHRPLLHADKPSLVGELSASATGDTFTPLPPAPPAASPPRRLLRHQAHSASADNLLIRTTDLATARDVPSLPVGPVAPRGVDLTRSDLLDEGHPAPSGKSLSFEEPPVQDTTDLDQQRRPPQMPRRDVSPKALLKNSKSSTDLVDTSADQRGDRGPPSGVPAASDPRIRHIWSEAIELGEIRNVEDQTEFRSLRAQLGIDKISSETLSQYHVKGHMDHFDQPAICYPRYRGPSTRNRLPAGLKLIRRLGEKLIKENYPSTDDKARFTGMFGLHMLTQFDNRVVLTTNERDALAVYDASNGIPALSLPKGERFDQSVLPYLEDFDLVYLWFPSIHERFAKDYASYMNATRCYIITAPLRPVELVRDGRAKEVLHNIQDAVRVRYKGFRSVGDLRDSVRSEIVESKSRLGGIAQWRRYALLNTYLRGFRPGEITVISGGHYGKTTFLCEYAMDLYSQGIRTLFCNFEMPEDKILKWMIIQFAAPSHVRSQARARSHAFFSARSKAPLQRQEHSSVEMWLDKFERTQGDLLIMKTDEFRDKTLKEISDAIRDQVITSGIQHLVIDNLQSLVDLATVSIDTMSAGERIHQQDRFVSMLRRLANIHELHITLVVHPVREPNEHGYYELQHLGGPSAKIAQEADNVLVIQRRRDFDDRRRFRKFLYILKNRYGGRCIEVDQIEMLFQPTTLMHALVEVNK